MNKDLVRYIKRSEKLRTSNDVLVLFSTILISSRRTLCRLRALQSFMLCWRATHREEEGGRVAGPVEGGVQVAFVLLHVVYILKRKKLNC
jgi:hypothetical protein